MRDRLLKALKEYEIKDLDHKCVSFFDFVKFLKELK